MESEGNPDALESKLKISAGLRFQHEEVEQKLTVREMRLKGFSKNLVCKIFTDHMCRR